MARILPVQNTSSAKPAENSFITKERVMAIHGIPTGVHRYDRELACDGYNLFSPYFRNETHLMPNGDLVRGIRVPNQAVLFAGTTGGFERYDWEGNLLQRYIMNDHETQQVLSHAFCPMPNGNTIVICLEKSPTRKPMPGAASRALFLKTASGLKENSTGGSSLTISWKSTRTTT